MQEEWEWFRREAGPHVAAGQPAQWMAAAAPPPFFTIQPDGGLHYTFLDHVINGPLLRSIQPSIISPALPAGVQVIRELTNSLMVCEPGHVSSSFRCGVRLGFRSDVPMFAGQWLQLVLPALWIGAGQALSVAILDMAKAPHGDSLPSSIASRLFENELMPDELMFPEDEEEEGD